MATASRPSYLKFLSFHYLWNLGGGCLVDLATRGEGLRLAWPPFLDGSFTEHYLGSPSLHNNVRDSLFH